MGVRWTRNDVCALLNKCRNENRLQYLYREKCVRHTSNLCGTKIPESEAVAEWLCSEAPNGKTNFQVWKTALNGSAVKRINGYAVDHDFSDKDDESQRYEEFIAYGLAYDSERGLPLPIVSGRLGRIVGIQVPLNNIKNDHLGKAIDLVSYDEVCNELLFVELKQDKSQESLLRSILEAYTYLKWIADIATFKSSFRISGDANLTICPAIFLGTKAANILELIKSGSDSVSCLQKLIGLIEEDIGAKIRFVVLDPSSQRVEEYRKGILRPTAVK